MYSLMPEERQPLSLGRLLWRPLLPVLALYTSMVLWYGYALTGAGGWAVRGSELFVLLPTLALAGVLLSWPGLFWSRTLEATRRLQLRAACVVVLFVPFFWLAGTLRQLAFARAAARAEPLIAAIERYVRENGAPPRSIVQLVPAMLPRLPAGLPPLELVTTGDLRGNPWALVAETPIGFLNWDRFLFLPWQNYPPHGLGGWLERIGRWAYVHE